MNKMESIENSRDAEQALFEEREKFVLNNYPVGKSHYDKMDIVNTGLDGMDVLEKRGEDGNIEGMISYVISHDREKTTYLSIGIILVSEDLKGEGVMKELFTGLMDTAHSNDCEYIAAIADTDEGGEFLLDSGFNEETDEVNGREYLRLDL